MRKRVIKEMRCRMSDKRKSDRERKKKKRALEINKRVNVLSSGRVKGIHPCWLGFSSWQHPLTFFTFFVPLSVLLSHPLLSL